MADRLIAWPMKTHFASVVYLILLQAASTVAVFAQDATFTYQGHLKDGGVPANGSYDIRFSLYDAPIAGGQVGTSVTNNSLAVKDGLFTVTLDFGLFPFFNDSRWLEIAVRTNGGGNFTALSARQKLSPTPYAIRSALAESAINLAGTIPVTQLSGMLPLTQVSGVGTSAYSNAAAFYPSSNPSNFVTRTATLKRFNVMQYGASGVGIVAQDSPAFKAAWNDAFANGGVVYAPRGMYVDTNSYLVPAYASSGPHSGQGGSEFFIEGDGKDATFIYVATSNPVYLRCGGQIPGIKGLTFQNVGGAEVSCLVATNVPGVMGYLHDAAFRGFYKGADIAAHDGLRVTGCQFYNCYIGLRVAGFSDGVNVEARADACRAGVVIGGLMPSQGYSKANGGRFHLEGNGNGFHFVVARSSGNVLSGYTEHNTNAVVAVGYPPGLLPGETVAETQLVTTLNLESLVEGVPKTSSSDFVRLYVPCTALRLSGCYGGRLIHSMTASADSNSAWLAVGNTHQGDMVLFSNGSTVIGDGSATTYKTWSYRWNENHQKGSTANDYFFGTFFGTLIGNGANLIELSADAIVGGITTNFAVLAPGGRTNTLYITNGVIRAVR